MDPISTAIGAGVSLLGGVLSRDAQAKANEQNLAWAREQAQRQDYYTREGIQIRVADAKKAGIHPLYALGSPSITPGPISLAMGAESGLGTALQGMGQDISRAQFAGMTGSQRSQAVGVAQQTVANNLDNETRRLNNYALQLRIKKLEQELQAPPPHTVIGDANDVNRKPPDVSPTAVGSPYRDAAVNPDVTFARTPQGGYAPIPSPRVKESIEDSPYEWQHFLRNQMSAIAGQGTPFSPPPGKVWYYHPFSGQWTLHDYDKSRSMYRNTFDQYRQYLERR